MKTAQSPATGRPAEAVPSLPHERDQQVGATAPQPDPVIEQAHRDVEAGLVDTDMRATESAHPHRRAELLRNPRADVTPARPMRPRK